MSIVTTTYENRYESEKSRLIKNALDYMKGMGRLPPFSSGERLILGHDSLLYLAKKLEEMKQESKVVNEDREKMLSCVFNNLAQNGEVPSEFHGCLYPSLSKEEEKVVIQAIKIWDNNVPNKLRHTTAYIIEILIGSIPNTLAGLDHSSQPRGEPPIRPFATPRVVLVNKKCEKK